MNKFIRISEFAKHLFTDENIAKQATVIIQCILEASSPRLSDIAAKMPGTEAACYNRIQRILLDNDSNATEDALQQRSKLSDRSPQRD
jgi:hypothetical protein